MINVKIKIHNFLNTLLPKFNWVIVIGNSKIESNAIEIANYIKSNYRTPVYFVIDEQFKPYAINLLIPGIKLLNPHGLRFRITCILSKYIFSTHDFNRIGQLSKKQTTVNIWHGVGHKRIRLLRGEPGIPAKFTVATSDLTKRMFSECFGVPLESVVISGYPRNDLMIRAKKDADYLKTKINPDLSSFNKIIFWMPTFRRETTGDILRNGLIEKNPFQIEGFDDIYFNELLKENNTLCIVKPHYFNSTDNEYSDMSNVLIIDDEWIGRQNITLYHLLACTDILITDFSSVMMDFILLDLPVICFNTDLESYKATQGLYFEDIENWIPSRLIQNQKDFFDFLKLLLTTNKDPDKEIRKKIRDLYFAFDDSDSSKRLTEYVFDGKVNSKNR